MHVTVEMHGDLKKYAKNAAGKVEIVVQDKATVDDVVKKLAVDANEEWSAAIDGKLAYPEDTLSEGAVLLLFPPIAGGSIL